MSRRRMGLIDVLAVSVLGLRTRPARAALSALGVALGIATMIVVVGVPAAAHRDLVRELDALGTNVLRAGARTDGEVTLPARSDAMLERIGPVLAASQVANTHATVARNDRAGEDAGTAVLAARPDLLDSVHGSVASGRFLDAAHRGLPQAVLGAVAATRLGVPDLPPGRSAPLVRVGGRWFGVVGILAPMPLAADLERAVLVDWEAATRELGFDGHPTVVYARVHESRLESVRAVLAPTLSPELPGRLEVSRPSDALAAKRATQRTFSALFLGLAALALVVGGIGVANTMVVSVLERRREIGLRRALGARPGQIRLQFLGESLALSVLGGSCGIAAGLAATTGYAWYQGWPPVLPWGAAGVAAGGAVMVGALAGLYPAVRAARLAPVQALWSN